MFLRVKFCAWWQSLKSTNRKSNKAKPQYHLPPEIWEKIFQRLPAKFLVKCICVCKAWKSIITDQAFIFAHLSYRRANNECLFLQYQLLTNPEDGSIYLYDYDSIRVQSKKSEQYLLVRSDDKEVSCLAMMTTLINYPSISDLDVVGTCNGLVCLVKYTESLWFDRVIIMNPSIRKCVALPKLDHESLTIPKRRLYWGHIYFGFGFDSRNNDFKVVMLVLNHPTKIELYSLASGEWRSINYKTSSFCTCWNKRPKLNLTFVNGALHWMFRRRCNSNHRTYISTFDLTEETFGEIKLPKFWKESSCFDAYLLVRGSCLALTYYKKSVSDKITYIVCVMKEYGVVDSWDLVFSVDSTKFPDISRVVALMGSEKVVVQTSDQRILIVDDGMNKETVKDLELQKYTVDFAGDHVESLFLINHKENNASVVNKGIIDVQFVSAK